MPKEHREISDERQLAEIQLSEVRNDTCGRCGKEFDVGDVIVHGLFRDGVVIVEDICEACAAKAEMLDGMVT